MKIDKGKLIALLVEKTDDDKDAVRRKLDEMIDQIQEAVKSDRQFHIDNFGTFSRVEGELDFEPALQLETEINQKYTGMKPIELMEAFKESGAGEPVAQNGQETEVTPSEEEEVSTPDEPEEKPTTVPETESEDEETKQQVPPVPMMDEVDSDEKKDIPEPEDQEEDFEPVAEEPAIAESETETEQPRPAMRYGRERNSSSSTVLVLLALAIIVIAGAWMLYFTGVIGQSGNENSRSGAITDTTQQMGTQQGPPASTGDTTTAASEVEQNGIDSVSQSNQTRSTETAGRYGLRGTRNENIESAYTIVIHSFRLRSTVQEIADSLNREGYRTVLFEGAPNESARWRLGLGQFETINDAQQATGQLSAPYDEDHFITRIR